MNSPSVSVNFEARIGPTGPIFMSSFWYFGRVTTSFRLHRPRDGKPLSRDLRWPPPSPHNHKIPRLGRLAVQTHTGYATA